jgi:hypothetical protein
VLGRVLFQVLFMIFKGNSCPDLCTYACLPQEGQPWWESTVFFLAQRLFAVTREPTRYATTSPRTPLAKCTARLAWPGHSARTAFAARTAFRVCTGARPHERLPAEAARSAVLALASQTAPAPAVLSLAIGLNDIFLLSRPFSTLKV